MLQFNSIAEIDDLAMICNVLFLRYRAAVAARPVCMPAAAAAAYRCAGHGAPGPAWAAAVRRGLACLPSGGSGLPGYLPGAAAAGEQPACLLGRASVSGRPAPAMAAAALAIL